MKIRVGRRLMSVPRPMWRWMIGREAAAARKRLDKLSPDQRRVRNFTVTELARAGAPLAPEHIGERLGLERTRVSEILAELERKMTYLFRGDGTAVSWAYPVTVERTSHYLTFETGEQMSAA